MKIEFSFALVSVNIMESLCWKYWEERHLE